MRQFTTRKPIVSNVCSSWEWYKAIPFLYILSFRVGIVSTFSQNASWMIHPDAFCVMMRKSSVGEACFSGTPEEEERKRESEDIA